MKLDEKYHYGSLTSRRKKLIVILVMVLVLFVCSTFLFSVQKIEVKGNSAVSSEEICADLGLEMNMNMFYFYIAGMLHTPEINPLLSSVDVYMHWPNEVEVVVTERNVVGYVAYMGMYLCIDSGGYVVDSTHVLKEDIPVVKGVDVSSFVLGEALTTGNFSFSQTVMELCNAIAHYGLSARIVTIDLTDIDDIRLFTNRLEVCLGDEDDLLLKLQALEKILRATPEAEGILHLEDMNGQIYLEKNI